MRSQRRFQIFISSTFEDLKEERKQAIEVIFDRGHIPIALERFSASNESDLEVIRRVIADCQVYVLILGHRYGELVPGQDISFTELEYNLAESNGLLILPFIVRPDEFERRRQALDSRNTKDRAELSKYEGLRSSAHGSLKGRKRGQRHAPGSYPHIGTYSPMQLAYRVIPTRAR